MASEVSLRLQMSWGKAPSTLNHVPAGGIVIFLLPSRVSRGWEGDLESDLKDRSHSRAAPMTPKGA